MDPLPMAGDHILCAGEKKYSAADKISPTILPARFIMAPTNHMEGEPGMGYYLLGHGGSGDHGSEDRIRGICRVLPERPEVFSMGLEEDWHYGLGAVAGLTRHISGVPERCIEPGDWCVTAQPAGVDRLRRGTRTVLWGWTPGAERIGRRSARELSRFHAVIVPDRRSLEALHTAGLEKNVRLGPDPAFLVERQLRPLRGAFRKDTVGLCLSPAVCRFEVSQGLLYRSFCHLIRWLLDNTAMQIALIPYCVKPCCNDCLFLTAVEREFGKNDRILRREDGDCRVLRGDLSLCRCCVGTAGALAAWSCGVPGLCVGSSSRAQGIARMLFGSWQETVVSVGALKREDALTDCFRTFLKREDGLRRRLEISVSQYRRWAADWQWSSIA